MLDRTIPFRNVIMRCDRIPAMQVRLPEGMTIRGYQPGDEATWARLECAAGDFGTVEEAESYFRETYLRDLKQARQRCLFLTDAQGQGIGSCIAWHDERRGAAVPSLHWLIVEEAWQGRGLGRALATAVIEVFRSMQEQPVYIHTQPWSWKAILLYHSLGFRMQTSDTFSHYENQYDQAMAVLRGVLSAEQYELLWRTSQ